MQYAMIIDLERCVGCHACTIACKAEWEVPVEYGRNWVKRLGPSMVNEEIASTYYPGLCNHCTDPVCVPDCPADTIEMTFKNPATGEEVVQEIAATWKDPIDGTVQVDKSRCIGCGACAEYCPYGARYIDPDKLDDVSEDGKADKCTFCKPRVEAGLSPACVQTCITGARIFGDITDPQSEVSAYLKKNAKAIEAIDGDLGPNVYYYGKKKDIDLLFSTSTPELADVGPARKRALIAKLGKSMKKTVKDLTMIGVAGAVIAGAAQPDKEES